MQPLLARLPDLLVNAGAEQEWSAIDGFQETEG
jgi:hypothetical protein